MKVLRAVAILALLWATVANGHDWRRPDLDGWYGSLRNPHSSSHVIRDVGCCSKDDCHETEAEMRGNDWWARLGTRKVSGDWDLGEWVQVPEEAILFNQSNPTGTAVMCHSMSIDLAGHVTKDRNTVFCFIPPTES